MGTQGPFDFYGGFSSGYEFYSIPAIMATGMANCRYSNGSIIPRWSQVQVNSAALGGGTNAMIGLTTWIDNPNAVTALVGITNAKIYTADITSYLPSSAAITFTDRTGATTISSSNTLRYTFDSLNGILIVAGNSAAGGVPLKLTAYNANAAALGGSPPKADCVKVVNNFAFLGRQLNSASTYSTLNWSNVADPETWGAGNSITVNKNDGEPIMALGGIGSDLYIFKQTSIWRLSTITQTTSGGVTLGPLQLVVKGIGCAGPLCVDNLPNGDIVFLGFDGHFYEFDGSNVFDLSKQPYPGPNAYDRSSVTEGLSFGVVNTNCVVKVWRGINEVWVGYDTTVTGAQQFFTVFPYDFINRIWQGEVLSMYPKCFASSPVPAGGTNIFESSEILFNGSINGNVFARGNLVKKYSVDESGVASTSSFASTIKLAVQASDFVPRTFCFETGDTSTSLSNLSVYITFDGASFITPIYSTSGVLPTRIFVNIPLKQDSSTTNIMPTMLNFLIQFTGTGSSSVEIIRIGKIYVSDEIIR